MKSIAEIRSLIDGPINSIPTAFTKDGDVDWTGVQNCIEHGLSGGSKVSLLTYGDSQLELLSDSELCELTRLTVAHTGPENLVVAASRPRGEKETLVFAEFCRETGADIFMLFIGEYVRTGIQPQLAEFYKAVARVMPVMLVGFPDHKILDSILDEPRICAFKEDGSVDYAVDTMRRYGDSWKFLTGGGLRRNYTQWPFACHAYMSPWCVVNPEVNRLYESAMRGNDLNAASEIITKYDWPLFDLTAKYTGGWQTAWRGMMEILGLTERYCRAPMPSASDAEMEMLRDDLRTLGALT